MEKNLKQYLNKNYRELSLMDKFNHFSHILQALEEIHKKGLIHQDFHPGNILARYKFIYITDLGLCSLINEKNCSKIYGVLPYVAPEILFQEKPYTPASDIYSFGIIVWEILSGKSPYCDIPHDMDLTLRIHDGLRPQFQIRVPLLLEDLIKRC
jgi:serine/threonine protein kinase